MFSDPQSITYGGATISLPRIGSGQTSGTFRSSDALYELAISHDTKKRVRHVARFNLSKVAADPLQPATNRPYTMSCYVVVDVPLFGFSSAEQNAAAVGLATYLTASSGARTAQLLGSES